MTAQQGHKYRMLHTGREVLALSSGDRPSVAHINPGQLWPLGSPFDVAAELLEPMAMVYFGNTIPK